MPRTPRRDAIRVFRCYSCNAVVSKQWSAFNEPVRRRFAV
jgi:DNA-directed RNA polymerase subunit N (RpoN/RPB10)